jgi:hypothetical protein
MIGALVAAVLRAPLLAAARRHVQLGAEDGLDAGLLRSQVEIDATEEVAVVGEGDGRKLEVLRLLHQLLELGGAVEEAVLGVDVQMDEFGVLHPISCYSSSMVAGGLLVTS